MKTLLILSVLGSALFAQTQLRLEGQPQKSATELVAVQDVNGRYCAAIQVQSNLDGISYDSNNGVVRVDNRPGEDMVFLSPDAGC